MQDPFDLKRFVEAQDGGVYERALGELQAGRKQGHWIWFVFPQIAGLGSSAMNRRYAIGSLEEAVAYLEHPILGARLRDCVDAINALEGRSARQVFGADDVKLRSSLTLFHRAEPEEHRFSAALAKYFAGDQDDATLELLAETFGGS
ncbi:MAG TPA: DUF1810 domain-containing protein [Caulobacteraceae bacterium]|jgi:uncharacterized protein (DUF1810 family)